MADGPRGLVGWLVGWPLESSLRSSPGFLVRVIGTNVSRNYRPASVDPPFLAEVEILSPADFVLFCVVSLPCNAVGEGNVLCTD